MVVCPVCEHRELHGALFCSECGEQLAPGTVDFAGDVRLKPELTGTMNAKTGAGPEIVLYLVDTGQVIHLHARKDATLGRSSEGQEQTPEIDLAPYRALEAGVSRLHASICLAENGLSVVDLGSANGTCRNGKKLEPHVPCPLDNGDVLTLGKLNIQVLVRD